MAIVKLRIAVHVTLFSRTQQAEIAGVRRLRAPARNPRCAPRNVNVMHPGMKHPRRARAHAGSEKAMIDGAGDDGRKGRRARHQRPRFQLGGAAAARTPVIDLVDSFCEAQRRGLKAAVSQGQRRPRAAWKTVLPPRHSKDTGGSRS